MNITRAEALTVARDSFTPQLVKLSEMVANGKLSSTAAKEVFQEMWSVHEANLETINKAYKEN